MTKNGAWTKANSMHGIQLMQRRPQVFGKWTHNEVFKYNGFCFVLTIVVAPRKKLTHVRQVRPPRGAHVLRETRSSESLACVQKLSRQHCSMHTALHYTCTAHLAYMVESDKVGHVGKGLPTCQMLIRALCRPRPT